jgi:hypothetical protein
MFSLNDMLARGLLDEYKLSFDSSLCCDDEQYCSPQSGIVVAAPHSSRCCEKGTARAMRSA